MKKFILSILILCSLSIFAQDGTTLHFMRLNPYSNFSNPSSFLQYKGYIGIPAISNINVAVTNTGFHYNTLFGTNTEGVVNTIKLNDFVEKLSKNGNYLNTNIALNIIDFGFRTKHLMVSFSYRIRVDEYFNYNKDLFALPVYGNLKFVGEANAVKPNLNLCLNAYQEFGIGFQAQVSPHVYIGVRPKLLFGIVNAKTQTAQATLYTDPSDYAMKLNYQMDASLRSIVPINISDNFNVEIDPQALLKDWKSAFKNVGGAIDLGATYRINEHWGVAASVLDLGFVCWNTGQHIYGTIDSSSTRYNDGSFLFNGLTMADIEKIKNDPEGFKNELLGYFPLNHETLNKSVTALSSRFLVEGYYNLGKYHRFSALFQGRIVNRQFIPSFTVAWNGNFLNIFDLCVNYTIAPHSYTNLGVGIGFNLGVFHIYAATDNLIAICNSKSIQRSLLNTNNANVQLGIVFDWGKVQESKIEKKQIFNDAQ